jgi:hypothetical protein
MVKILSDICLSLLPVMRALRITRVRFPFPARARKKGLGVRFRVSRSVSRGRILNRAQNSALYKDPHLHPLPNRERKQNARFRILLLSLALAGCAAQPEPAPRPVMVKIPIATPIYCDVPALQQPPLPIAMLTRDSAPADTIRCYVATVDVLKSAVKERDTILRGCAAPPAVAGEVPADNAMASAQPNPRPLPSREGEQSQGKGVNAASWAGALVSKLRGLIPW